MAVPTEAGNSLSFDAPRALFDEPGLAWSEVDLSRYDATPDGQRPGRPARRVGSRAALDRGGAAARAGTCTPPAALTASISRSCR